MFAPYVAYLRQIARLKNQSLFSGVLGTEKASSGTVQSIRRSEGRANGGKVGYRGTRLNWAYVRTRTKQAQIEEV
jgi:hypothetical protein